MPKYSRFPKYQFPFTPTPKFQRFFLGGVERGNFCTVVKKVFWKFSFLTSVNSKKLLKMINLPNFPNQNFHF